MAPVEITQVGKSFFVGYSDKDVRRATNFVVSEKPPEIEEYENLISFPDVDALYHEDGSIVSSSRLVHHDEIMIPPPDKLASAKRKYGPRFPEVHVTPSDLIVVDEPVVLLGHSVSHWGHFLMEGLSRMWAVSSGAVDPSRERVLFTNMRRRIGLDSVSFARPLLSSLGVDLDRVIRPTVPTLFKRVRVAQPSVNYLFRIFPQFAYAHRRIAVRLASDRKFDRPIFISRSGISNAIHNFVGEDILRRDFEAMGFEVMHPETMTVADQIAMFRRSPLIVGSIGSAFHSILFEPECGERIRVMFSPPNPGRRFPMVDAICGGHESWYLNVVPKSTERGRALSIDLEMARCMASQLPIY